MSRTLGLLSLATLVLATACAKKVVKPDLPTPATIVAPMVIKTERRIYVPIEAELTRPEKPAEGSLSQCPSVAAERRAQIERLNGRMKSIAAKQGTEVKP